MNKIFNWTIGSFFRTIGRIFAFIFIGFLVSLIINKFNINLGFLGISKVNALTLPDHTTLPDPFDNTNWIITKASDNSYRLVYYPNNNELYYNLRINNSSYYNLYSQVYVFENMELALERVEDNYITFYSNLFHSDIFYNFSDPYIARFSSQSIIQSCRVVNNEWSSCSGVSTEYGYFSINKLVTTNIPIYTTEYSNDSCGYDYSCSTHTNDYITRSGSEASYTVSFYLNGGTLIDNSFDPDCPLTECGFIHGTAIYDDDFTLNFNDSLALSNFIKYAIVQSDTGTFSEWYYDSNFTDSYDENRVLNSNISLYAYYYTKELGDLINSTTFNEYTFPVDSQYAIISVKNNFNKGALIGLSLELSNILVYTFDNSTNEFLNDSFNTLRSIGLYDDYYYYRLQANTNSYSYITVIDKLDLIRSNNGTIEHYYDFLVSDNAEVSFTNSLKDISFYALSDFGNSNSLKQNYDISLINQYYKNYLLSNTSDMKNVLFNFKDQSDFSIFSNVGVIWDKLRSYKIFVYFLFVSITSIIVALVKGGSRH